ncbi:MAG: ATPase domain-containing protein [Candidatus Micrarchaeota archaeon]
MDIGKAFEGLHEGFVVLVMASPDEYGKAIIDIVKYFANRRGLPLIYVTANKPYAVLRKELERGSAKTDKMFFIDMITKKAAGASVREKDCLYIASPDSLTELTIALNSAVAALPQKGKVILLDSVSTLLMYNNAGAVGKFVHFFTAKMASWDAEGVLVSLEDGTDPMLVSQLSQFCSRTVHIKGGKVKWV